MVRGDIPFDRLSAQIGHAARKSATKPEHPGTSCVVLAVFSEDELLRIHARLVYEDIPCVLIREPDAPFNGAATAIGCEPLPRQRIRRLLSGLPRLQPQDGART